MLPALRCVGLTLTSPCLLLGRGSGLSLLCVLAPGSPFRNMGGPAAHLGEARPGCRELIQVLEQVFQGGPGGG